MYSSVELALFLLLNIDPTDERRRPCNALESAPSSEERILADAFIFFPNTSYFSVREVIGIGRQAS